MSEIIEKMAKIPDLNVMQGCSESQISEAERELNLKFPQEYLDYVRKYGCMDFGAAEWTGLNVGGVFNTVTATKQEQEVNPDFPKGFFVLENLGIDARLVIVNEKGEVYLLRHDKKTKLYDSISEYLESRIKENES